MHWLKRHHMPAAAVARDAIASKCWTHLERLGSSKFSVEQASLSEPITTEVPRC